MPENPTYTQAAEFVNLPDHGLTYAQAAQMALDCQNACNLSGIVHDFPSVMTALWAEANRRGEGTEWVNTHPIVALILDKLADLNGRLSEYGNGYWLGPPPTASDNGLDAARHAVRAIAKTGFVGEPVEAAHA